MKFRFASLLFLLSSTAFVNSPALSMEDFDQEYLGSYVPKVYRDPLAPFAEVKVDFDVLVGTYNVLRAKGNAAPNTELVGFLVGSDKWALLPRLCQRQLVNGVVERAQELRLEELMRESGVVPNYHAVRPKNDASDEDLVAYLFGKERWAQVKPDRQDWVVYEVIKKARELEIEEPIAQEGILEKYRFARAEGNKASDNDLVAYLFKERWATLNPEVQEEIVRRVVSKSEDMDKDSLLSLIRSGKLEEAFGVIRATDAETPDEVIIMQVLENLNFDGWDRLPEEAHSFMVGAVTRGKKEEIAFELFTSDEKVQVEVAKSYRSIKDSGNPSSDEEIVRYVLEQMGFKYWDALDTYSQQRAVQKTVELAEEISIPKWLRYASTDLDEALVAPLLIGIEDEWDRRDIFRELCEADERADGASLVDVIVKHKDVFLPERMKERERAECVKLLLRYDVELIDALAQHKSVFFPPEMDTEHYSIVIDSLRKADAGQIKTVAQGAKLLPLPNSYNFRGSLKLLMKSDPARVQLVAQNTDIFSFTTFPDLERLMELDVEKIQAVAEAVKALLPEEMEEYYRNHLIGVFIESDLTALQILAQNKEVLLDPEMSDYTRRDVIKKILATDVERIRALVQNKNAFLIGSMERYVPLRLVNQILSLPPEVSAEEIGMTAAVLSANSAFLFPSEMEGEDRARIIEAAFQCSADKLNARLIALEENTGTLLKDMKGRDHTGMVITGLGVEAEEIVSRAAAIERNKGVYFPEETEGANRVIAALLNTDASKIEALAPRAELLLEKMDSYMHVNVILALLNADFDRVPELIKYKGLLFKDSFGWNIERIIESALKLNAEELSRRVVAIEKVLLPDSVLSRLVGGRYFEHIYEEIVLALLKKSVEETDAYIMAFERNAATFLTAPFTKSLQDQYDSVRIVPELIKLSAEEIDNRAEIINRHAKILFPAEISDHHKVQIMLAVVAISGDKLDAAVPKIAEAYARVEESADSDARARVIIDNLPRYYDW